MAHSQLQPLYPTSESEADDSFSPSTQNLSPGRSPNPNPVQIPTLLHLSFNQDYSCFSVATDIGFSIYRCDPVSELYRRDSAPHGVGLVQMLFGCNLLAVVGGGPNPVNSPNKVMIWDDNLSRCFCELSFRSNVKGVRLRRDRIIVVLVHKIFLYTMTDFKLVHQIETIANPKGLCEVSQMSGQTVLVCPGLQKGQVRVELCGSRRIKFIMAHSSNLACMALTLDGRLLATASSKGTLIRIFNTLDGSLLQEVRRGADQAVIYSLAFSSPAQWLAVSSEKGTVHVFSLKVDSGSLGNDRSYSAPGVNAPSSSGIASLSFMKGVLPKYFSSEWSVAKYHLHEGLQCIVGFGQQKNTVMILGMDGSFYRCQFDPVNGGEMTQLEYHYFLKPEETF